MGGGRRGGSKGESWFVSTLPALSWNYGDAVEERTYSIRLVL